jgi:phenylacetic acid degradation operon negative regulatory protein
MTAAPPAPASLQPQSLLMSLVGLHQLDTDRPVSGTSVVHVLGRLGVAEPAARSVLQRVTTRGLIARHKEGRRTFYSPTDHGRAVLEGGRTKMFHRWREDAWDGRWTFVNLTVPESHRKLRHRIGSQLTWAGFARTSDGLWVAPGRHEVTEILGQDALAGPDAPDDAASTPSPPVVIYGHPCAPTTDAQLVEPFDLDRVDTGFRDFLARWDGDAVDAAPTDPVDALVTRLQLHAEWLTLTRADPQLPDALLPTDWPGGIAGDRFRALDAALAEQERPVIEDYFAGALDRLPRSQPANQTSC